MNTRLTHTATVATCPFTGAAARGASMDYKIWKSGRHDPESKKGSFYGNQWADPVLRHSVNQVKRFRYVCSYCMKHKRTCPVCAGVF